MPQRDLIGEGDSGYVRRECSDNLHFRSDESRFIDDIAIARGKIPSPRISIAIQVLSWSRTGLAIYSVF
jgi:hypothetical protein